MNHFSDLSISKTLLPLTSILLLFNLISSLHLELKLHNSRNRGYQKVTLVCFSSKNINGSRKDIGIPVKQGTQTLGNPSDSSVAGSVLPTLKINSPGTYNCYYRTERINSTKSRRRRKRDVRKRDSVKPDLDYCPPGYKIDQDNCVPCPPGSYGSGQELTCHLCPKNYYAPNKASDSCLLCPDGLKTAEFGSTSDNQCISLDDKENQVSKLPSNFTIVFCIIFIVAAWVIAFLYYCGHRLICKTPFVGEKKKKNKTSKVPEIDALIEMELAHRVGDDDEHTYRSFMSLDSLGSEYDEINENGNDIPTAESTPENEYNEVNEDAYEIKTAESTPDSAETLQDVRGSSETSSESKGFVVPEEPIHENIYHFSMLKGSGDYITPQRIPKRMSRDLFPPKSAGRTTNKSVRFNRNTDKEVDRKIRKKKSNIGVVNVDRKHSKTYMDKNKNQIFHIAPKESTNETSSNKLQESETIVNDHNHSNHPSYESHKNEPCQKGKSMNGPTANKKHLDDRNYTDGRESECHDEKFRDRISSLEKQGSDDFSSIPNTTVTTGGRSSSLCLSSTEYTGNMARSNSTVSSSSTRNSNDINWTEIEKFKTPPIPPPMPPVNICKQDRKPGSSNRIFM